MFDRLIILHAAAAVGIQKLVFLVLIFYMYGDKFSGDYAAISSLISFAGCFTAIGYGAQLIKDVAGSQLDEQKNALSWGVGSSFLCSNVVFLVVVGVLEIGIDLLSIYLFLLSFSVYQLIRHYYLGKADYILLLLYDLSNLTVYVLTIFLIDESYFYVIGSLGSLSLALWVMLYERVVPKLSLNSLLAKDAVIFSISSVVGSGILLLVPFVLSYRVAPEYLAKLSINMSIVLLFVLPLRSYLTFYLPKLVVMQNDAVSIRQAYKKISSNYYALLLFTLFLSLLGLLGVGGLSEVLGNDFSISLIMCFVLSFFVFSNQPVALVGNVLFAYGLHKYTMYSNIAYFLIAVCLSFGFIYHELRLYDFFIVLSLISISRYYYLKKVLNA